MSRSYHNQFKINGNSFQNDDELLFFSKQYSDELFEFIESWLNKLTYITVQTSGSTGKPKKIEILKKHMTNSALATGKFFNLSENTAALLCMPIRYIAGKMMLVRAMELGWNLTIQKPSSHPLTEFSVFDFIAMVPMQAQNSLPFLHNIKTVLVGGGVIPTELRRQLKKCKSNIYESYGMTETITHIALRRVSQPAEIDFTLLPEIAIEKDSRGCLVIHAPNISRDTVFTNDLVRITSKNTFQFVGRFDNIINSGGIKLVPEQIEAKLANIIAANFFVFGLPDDILGEKLVLIIESKNNNKKLLDKITSLETLEKYEHPKELFFLESFVYTHTQKINRLETIKKLPIIT